MDHYVFSSWNSPHSSHRYMDTLISTGLTVWQRRQKNDATSVSHVIIMKRPQLGQFCDCLWVLNPDSWRLSDPHLHFILVPLIDSFPAATAPEEGFLCGWVVAF